MRAAVRGHAPLTQAGLGGEFSIPLMDGVIPEPNIGKYKRKQLKWKRKVQKRAEREQAAEARTAAATAQTDAKDE